MGTVICMYIVMLGMCFGSFLNVVATRAVEEKELFGGRSRCDGCGHQLAWYDLIPFISFIWLKGRCRYCRRKIGIRHLVVEIIDGFACLLAFSAIGFSLDFIFVFMLIQLFILLSLIDWDVMIIPDLLLVLLIFPVISLCISHPEFSLVDRVIGMFCVSGMMIIINCLVAESFGGGDVKLMMICGFLLGWKLSLLSGFFGVVIAGIYAMYLLNTKKVGRKDHIAFGPFLCLGVFFALLYGGVVLNWYLSLF